VAFTTASTALVVSLVAPGVRAGRLATFGAAANIAIALAPAAITLLLVFAPLEAGLVAPAVFACVAGMLVARLPPTPSQDGSLARQAPASARDAAGAGLQRGVEQSGSTELLSRAVSQGASETGPTLASELGTSGERLLLMLAPPRRVWWPMLVTGLLGAGFAAFFQFGPILADRSAISPGLLYTVYGVAIIGTRLASGRLLNRLEVVQVVIPAALLMTFAYALIATNQTLAPVALGVALVAVSGGLFHPALLAHHAALLPDAPGRASAAFYVAFDLGIGLGSWAFGVVLNLGGLGWLYSAAAMFAAGAAGVSVWSRLARPLAPREAAPIE
jgi:hypothetical protein